MNRLKVCFVIGSLALATLGACGDDDDAVTDNTDIDAGETPDSALPVDSAPPVDVDPGAPDADLTPNTFEVVDNITSNTTWTYPDTYVLNDHIYVKNGAKLTIEPGVVIKGKDMTSLVVTREGQIEAVGTAERPIVFTSNKAEGMRAGGDWGGLVILGKAKINVTAGEQPIEGFPQGTADTTYGGQDDAHNCGKLKYVRVEFAGYTLSANNELNGITVGGCGSQTELDYIQVHRGSDDAIEFFGGTANLKHAVLSQGSDDGLDWDLGWRGNVQFVVVQIGQGEGEHGFEADNHPTDFGLLPRSSPTIYNATVVGPDAPTGKTKVGMMLRRGTAAKIYNAIIMNANGIPVDVDDASTFAQYPAELFIKNSIFFGNGAQAAWNDSGDDIDEGAAFRAGSLSNREADPQIAGATSSAAPTFKPAAASPALTGAATPPAGGFFDATATFVGAVGPTDWTQGWTAFPAN